MNARWTPKASVRSVPQPGRHPAQLDGSTSSTRAGSLFTDMAIGLALRKRRGVLAFDLVLQVLTVALTAVTVAGAPLLGLFLTGRGPLTVPVQVERPYSVGFFDGRRIEAASANSAWVNFPEGDEKRYSRELPVVRASVRLDPADTDTRVVLSAAAALFVALGWLGLLSLRAIVRSARTGDPFLPENGVRLRRLAMAVLLLPMVTAVGTRLVDRTLDVDIPVDVVSIGPAGWTPVIVGIGLLALVEIFRDGSVLRQFEHETV